MAPECSRKGLHFPPCASHWVDARRAFAEWHSISQLNVKMMLEWAGMSFEGRPHSGIDDTRNIARLVIHLLSQGCVLSPNCDVKSTSAPLPWLGAGTVRPAAGSPARGGDQPAGADGAQSWRQKAKTCGVGRAGLLNRRTDEAGSREYVAPYVSLPR